MAIFQVKVNPLAAKNSLEGWQGETLRIRLHATPEKGKANEALIAFLSEQFGVSKSEIRILSGMTTRLKRIEIRGKSLEEIKATLLRTK